MNNIESIYSMRGQVEKALLKRVHGDAVYGNDAEMIAGVTNFDHLDIYYFQLLGDQCNVTVQWNPMRDNVFLKDVGGCKRKIKRAEKLMNELLDKRKAIENLYGDVGDEELPEPFETVEELTDWFLGGEPPKRVGDYESIREDVRTKLEESFDDTPAFFNVSVFMQPNEDGSLYARVSSYVNNDLVYDRPKGDCEVFSESFIMKTHKAFLKRVDRMIGKAFESIGCDNTNCD